MVIAALVMDLIFTGLRLVPSHDTDVRAQLTHFSLNYTFWLNLLFGALGLYLWWISRQHPMQHGHDEHEHANQRSGSEQHRNG
ncbi:MULTISPECIES: hypothetical protein [Methylobacterium]|uniref:DUF2243 domain-containing protein n=1 Tax=Methylobacterium komagatae TaxID=374425 RepID=A0ABW2BJY8_9HYPH